MPRRTRISGEGDATPPPKRHRYSLRNTSSRSKRDAKLGGEQDGRRSGLSDEDFRDKNKALHEKKIEETLVLSDIDLHMKTNRFAHHTDEYEMENLIVRRGQKFTMSFIFNRNVSKDRDLIVLQFTSGARPQESKGTLIRVPVDLEKVTIANDGWTVKTLEAIEKTVKLEFKSEADSNIGKYDIFVETKLKDSKMEFSRVKTTSFFYMLFNAWNKDDVVYMANAAERDEYVLNESGRIWCSTDRSRPWHFGQFKDPVLEVALNLLDKGELGDAARKSAVSVIRCISALANNSDEDGGVLEGRWTKMYPEGSTKPWEWIGSVSILRKYQQTGGNPVQYGQCWVFSALVTTLMRTLGIPTRSVTNFDSAHDCDCSMTIDEHFDMNGEPLEDEDDSVWNFHVWNESWLKRYDLPVGYDGWQAHDATPQETSEGVYRCGPAPLEAIKKGHVYLNFDVGFIYSEVNGDKVEWEVADDGSMKAIHVNSHSVGRNISTKCVGRDNINRHDLTLDYKYKEGSEKEEDVRFFVNRYSTDRKKNLYKNMKPVEMTLEAIVPEDRSIGEDFVVGIKATNITNKNANIRVTLTLASTFYTGVSGARVKSEITETDLNCGEKKDVTMKVSAKEYEKVMNAQATFKLTAVCRMMQTDNMHTLKQVFTLEREDLTFKVPEKLCCYKEDIITVEINNTTNFKLHNGVLNTEGSYIASPDSVKLRKVIQPHEVASVDVKIKPYRSGSRDLFVSFSSDELSGFDGAIPLNILRKEEYEEAMETEGDN